MAAYRASTLKNTVSMNSVSSPNAPSSLSGRQTAKRLDAANRTIAAVNHLKSTGARKSWKIRQPTARIAREVANVSAQVRRLKCSSVPNDSNRLSAVKIQRVAAAFAVVLDRLDFFRLPVLKLE